MRFYVINLDRSPERWAWIERDAAEQGLDIERVPGVDGKAVAREAWIDVDHRAFRLLHGRLILPGEYGCYRSHLEALDTVIRSGDDIALICEDDVTLGRHIVEKVRSIVAERPDLDMLKLTNHRVKGFVRHGGRGETEFGRCIHGPQASAACYAVTREGALRLRAELGTMRLPYDVAFERGWAMKATIFTMRWSGVHFRSEGLPSTIVPGKGEDAYARSKPNPLLRLPTAAFRAGDYARRARYALR